MRIIAIANQKGGCGKTTTAINLSASLAKHNRKVLLIDMDPQGHSTLGYNVRPEEIGLSVYHVLKEGIPLDNIILNTGITNLSLAPSNIVLSAIEQDIAGSPEKEKKLSLAISALKKVYNYIIIDCPPNLGLLSINALRAAGEVIIPLEPSFFSLHGLGKLLETIEVLNRRSGHKVETCILPTMHNRRSRFAREVLQEVKSHFKGIIFSSPIRVCTKLRESVSFGCPVSEYATNSIGHWDYTALTEEVLLQEDPSLENQSYTVSTSSINTVSDMESNLVSEKPQKPYLSDKGVLFVYKDPMATEVKIAGDFNEWMPDKGVVSIRDEDGTWKKIINVSPGVYQYRFYIDGEWKEDPGNPNIVENELGSCNSLLIIN